MDINELTQLMVKNGLVIRAIPHERTSTYEVRHANNDPNGVVKYMEEYGRDMFQVTTKNTQGGKFIIAKVSNQDTIVNRWHRDKKNNVIFYDTIEEAVASFLGLEG